MERELINHRSLLHPNIIRFKEVFVTSTHLGIVMEYAAGGELFDRIVKAGRFSEDEARYFFQQLISGVEYCHSQVWQSPKSNLVLLCMLCPHSPSKRCQSRDLFMCQHWQKFSPEAISAT